MDAQRPEGVTSIDDILGGGGGNVSDSQAVDSILQEINSTKSDEMVMRQQQAQHQQQVAQQQAAAQQAAAQQQIRLQQEQLQQLSKHVQMKDQENSIQNNQSNTSSNTYDLFLEFKSTIIIFILISIFTLPALNKFVVNSIGIEENSIFSILKCFIICIIFFLINKFI